MDRNKTIKKRDMRWSRPYGNFKFKCEEEIQKLYDSPNTKKLIDFIKSVKERIKRTFSISELLKLESILKTIADNNNLEDKIVLVKRLRLRIARVIGELEKRKELEKEHKDKIDANNLEIIKNLHDQLVKFKHDLDASFEKLRLEYKKFTEAEKRLLLKQGLQTVVEEIKRVNDETRKDVFSLSSIFVAALGSLKNDPVSAPPHLRYMVNDVVDHVAHNFEQDMLGAIDRVRENLDKTVSKIPEIVEGDTEPHKEPESEEVQRVVEIELDNSIEKRLKEKIDEVLKGLLRPGENLDEKRVAVEGLQAQIRKAYKDFRANNKAQISRVVDNVLYEYRLKQTEAIYKEQLANLKTLEQQIENAVHQLNCHASLASSDIVRPQVPKQQSQEDQEMVEESPSDSFIPRSR